jgi:hypothetical protein
LVDGLGVGVVDDGVGAESGVSSVVRDVSFSGRGAFLDDYTAALDDYTAAFGDYTAALDD